MQINELRDFKSKLIKKYLDTGKTDKDLKKLAREVDKIIKKKMEEEWQK